ncbi:hypothetical protein AGABI1DRAFT_51702 [Agaricus bisporus var. burnettii JB137-S8]|uniref:RNA helicase n=1 Tax=Agaricus bisporus var. burnettii (strain JB137-S8 / ATCC MYA-4627 / FGSC 10392) TaxID=597362 RepID=K5XKW7_AGABU|nr:uncharacterized protein AGABI1DRAFT_51702 [Agaricus bisporus var. burnettii JB137-S8]EKM84037.1 hypothetical protein AGABI1DRAFT_51702 [Agaricus bisporus var. burnettii JB137-S8]
MPPRRGIVKSGNAGNSSKSTSKAIDSSIAKPDNEKEKPLFPPGSKFPLSLLHEKCQKRGWEKPIVDTPRHGEQGYSFVLNLVRINKKTSEREIVRLSPHPPYYRPSIMEARQWGATYALYRFENGFPINRVLPPGPRDYWNELATEHKSAPEHLQWMYAADPFAALQMVRNRQEKVAQSKEAGSRPSGSKQSTISSMHSDTPEVKMAALLRVKVEKAIKEGFDLYGNDSSSALDEQVIAQVSAQLKTLGFQEPQIKKATLFLSQQSPLLGKLLKTLRPFEAVMEYLLLYMPECDLPSRFLPVANSSKSFISSAHSGTSGVKKRWMEDKAVKEAGWPIHAVQEFTGDSDVLNDWPLLLVKLGNKLLGIEDKKSQDQALPSFAFDEDELLSLGAVHINDGYYELPALIAPLTLHIFFNTSKGYPRPFYSPMFITSAHVPPYIRLHILSCVLSAVNCIPNSEDTNGSLALTLINVMDEEWARLEDNGPPDISTVMTNMLPEEETIDAPATMPFRKEREPLPPNRSKAKSALRTSKQSNILSTISEMRRRLPAFKARRDFLNYLLQNRAVVVVGETGSGKTTQLPQYILESYEEESWGHTEAPYIIVTQPRRISAISVAQRVSNERGNDGTVGYAIRGSSNHGKTTRLLFCTTGVILRRLSNGDQLQNVSHVVVDEVHERSLDGDFLLLALKQLLRSHLKLKVVLMSATINHGVFAEYFGCAPVLAIPGITHPVTDIYLEDIVSITGYSIGQLKDIDNKKLDELRFYHGDDFSDETLAVIHNLTSSGNIDYQLIATLLAHIIEKHERGGVLIFLPGVNEIKRCIDTIKSRVNPAQIDAFPLHANLSIEEQNRVFRTSSKWKVIASTNVAETSITIDDIVYVIDSGKVKETRYMPDKDLTRLEEVLIARASARQRRGRAGRTHPGLCFKLYTRHTESATMEEFSKPEILRVPLEQVSLSAKAMNEEGNVTKLLGQVIDPPDSATVMKAWQSLQELGAIDSQDRLTPLGRHIAMIPLDVRLAKMLVLGTIFHCLNPILSITALLSSKPFYISVDPDRRDEASQTRMKFNTENSDLLTQFEIFDQCRKLKELGKDLRSFCKENFISMTTLQDVFNLRREFCAALEERGFLPPQCDPMDPTLNLHSENSNLLKAIILGGLWPRVVRVHLPRAAIKFDQLQSGTIQRDNTAREFKMFDLREGRVFIHPGSVLFHCASWKSPFLVYFHKYQSSKIFLSDATEVPMYALLLFGGSLSIDHVKGGLNVSSGDAFLRLKAWPRIGVLVNQLRQLLDLLLTSCIEDGSGLNEAQNHPVIGAMLDLLTHDGMTE